MHFIPHDFICTDVAGISEMDLTILEALSWDCGMRFRKSFR